MRFRKRQILVPLYFYLGGLAGGCFVVAAASHFAFGSPAHPLALRGFAVAFPLILFSALVLTIDLTQPTRFWRLFTRFKLASPVSVGSWALLGFGLLSAAAWVRTFISVLGPFLPEVSVGWILKLSLVEIEVIGLPLALFVASYTGVLLNTSARPIWASQPLLGGLFFASSLATSVALLGSWSTADHALSLSTLGKLLTAEKMLLLVQLTLTAGFVIVAVQRVGLDNARLRELLRGRLSLLFHGSWLAGIVFPLMIWVASPLRAAPLQSGLIAILIGGLAMRYAVFLCDEPGG